MAATKTIPGCQVTQCDNAVESSPDQINQQEFANLYSHYWSIIWAIAFRFINDAHRAEDISQETFKRLWLHLNDGIRFRDPEAWLSRVATNLAKDDIRSAFRRKRSNQPNVLELIPSVEESRNELAKLHEALSHVPPHYREAFVRRQMSNESPVQVALDMGLTQTALKRILDRTQARLRKLLTE